MLIITHEALLMILDLQDPGDLECVCESDFCGLNHIFSELGPYSERLEFVGSWGVRNLLRRAVETVSVQKRVVRSASLSTELLGEQGRMCADVL